MKIQELGKIKNLHRAYLVVGDAEWGKKGFKARTSAIR